MLGQGPSLPDGYRERLQTLLKNQWQMGESYAKIAHRLGIGSSRTAKAWLTLDWRTEPDAQKLRSLAEHLGWQYWELIRYLDTGEQPDRNSNKTESERKPPSEPSSLSLSNNAKTALVASARQMRDLADSLYQSLESVPLKTTSPKTSTDPSVIPFSSPSQFRETAQSFSPLKKPQTKTLSQMVQDCIERFRLNGRDIEQRLRDRNYYVSSRDLISEEDFEAMRQGVKVPQSETQLELLADVVDRDRENFSHNYWLKAWIVSIYQGTPSPDSPQSKE
ncbi:hypothetical protein PN462_11625 [Spirulina sp. CS-785/01]|uniref:hypothetical protein n=1 Tax=Spirulina sp. CS-785/01 TaxID=3021716 RepID=UPI00232EB509|nr:hypothetical protein [Spirulina sp. CS-785/01]MDB9313751.1 hypothetical protein [Spirulina sp. CS-785/01]